MSSLSKEDLAAGGDGPDLVATASNAAAPNSAESVPPTSITVERKQGSLESLVVPAGGQTSTTLPIEPPPFALERPTDEESSPTAPSLGGAANQETANESESEAVAFLPSTERANEQAPLVASNTAGVTGARSAMRKWATANRHAIWLAAAILGFAVAFFGFKAKKRSPHVASSITRIEEANRNATHQANEIHFPESPSQAPVAQPIAEKPTASEPVAVTRSESFSDAFVKHAATLNSNWIEVKKRAKPSDTQSTNRSGARAASPSNDSPLDVLDQLEKVRKAKKQTSSAP